jgi:integrase
MKPINVSFFPEKRKDKTTGKIKTKGMPILFKASFDSKFYKSTTGLKCNQKQWSSKTGKMKSSAADSQSMNTILENIATELKSIYLDIIAKKETPTVEKLRDKFRNKQEKSFFDYYIEFTRTQGKNNAWSMGTYAKFKTLRGHLERFTVEKNITLEFSNINGDFYQALFDYHVEQGHRNSYIKKSFKNFNWFVRWAIITKKQKVTDYNCFTVKTIGDNQTAKHLNMVFLKPDEFITMYQAVIPDIRLSRLKDAFTFMCASGLRFSDYHGLTDDNITDDSIIVTTQKTDDPLEIPLNEFSRAILAKYPDGLPKLSNVNFNIYIKELCQLLNFDRKITKTFIRNGEKVKETKPLFQVISTHAARKTFVSLSVFLNMNTEILMAFTGHKEHKMLKQYLGIDGKQKAAEMKVFTTEGLLNKIAN